VDANLVIVTMAWMTGEDGDVYFRHPQEPDMHTLAYWVSRLEPVVRSENDDEIIVVFCNRTGTEDDAVYTGTSAVVGIKDGEVKLYGILGRCSKELLVVDTNTDLLGILAYRPTERAAAGKSMGEASSPAQIRSTLTLPRPGKHGLTTLAIERLFDPDLHVHRRRHQ
jgi:hypothetical protein